MLKCFDSWFIIAACFYRLLSLCLLLLDSKNHFPPLPCGCRWLLSCCRDLASAVKVVVVNGEHSAERQTAIDRDASCAGIADYFVHSPPLPIPFGTHHTKAFLLQFVAGVRVIVHTANLIYPDCNNKTQGKPQKYGSINLRLPKHLDPLFLCLCYVRCYCLFIRHVLALLSHLRRLSPSMNRF